MRSEHLNPPETTRVHGSDQWWNAIACTDEESAPVPERAEDDAASPLGSNIQRASNGAAGGRDSEVLDASNRATKSVLFERVQLTSATSADLLRLLEAKVINHQTVRHRAHHKDNQRVIPKCKRSASYNPERDPKKRVDLS
ncbi:hypothetical protein KUCAC02_025140 [Chaenocephalus aceratus]|nr:hypothetical protein KUCAC02_033064 [Chaenocephalus aceratus]KAI4797411.1 hypothetical protein KUCAC02_025140 [Chaenocephalus aceratus]